MAERGNAPDSLRTQAGHGPATLKTCLRLANDRLDKAGIDGYDVEARILCEWVTGCTRLQFVTNGDEIVSPETVTALEVALTKRLSGMPVHRVMGFREFYGLRLELSEATLEPRPDTEILVDQVIDIIEKRGAKNDALRIIDLGTGTGAIALALLSNLPRATALGVDLSQQALETAQKNAKSNNFDARFSVLQSDWFENITGKFDVIVSNPPYIRTEIIEQLDVEVRDHDPLLALDGGPDGLIPYREIAAKSGAFLNEVGIVAVEIGYDQASDITSIFGDFGFELIELRRDLGGRNRALAFKLNKQLFVKA